MRRNLDRRMETIMPVADPQLKQELEQILNVYEDDNCSAWDMQPDGKYVKRRPRKGEQRRAAQDVFIDLIGRQSRPGGKDR
jgi:polyphosphate kinase